MRRFCCVIGIGLSLMMAALAIPVAAQAQVICVSNALPPPELPMYEQPPIPAPGYMWIPGYWAGGPTGYFWVPGTWVLPPAVGLLWTPGYWSWRDGIYVWNAGYWGPHIGFYGGVDYGFGYNGDGYFGGRWDHGVFAYNRTVNNFGEVRIAHVYEQPVAVDPHVSRVSFNGGSGGTTARPTAQEQAAAHERHVAALPAQFQHERTASSNKALFASENHGLPPVAATVKPGEFTGKGIVAAHEEKPGAKLGPAVAPIPTENKHFENKSLGTTNGAPEPLQNVGKGQEAPKELKTDVKHPDTEAHPPKVETERANIAPKPPTPPPPAPANKNLQEHTLVAPASHPTPPPPPKPANPPPQHTVVAPPHPAPPPPPKPAPPKPAPKDKDKKPQ